MSVASTSAPPRQVTLRIPLPTGARRSADAEPTQEGSETVDVPTVVSKRMPTLKVITCPYCGGLDQVSPKAMSIFCKHCRKRLILENYKITSYYAVREFFTCGDVVVEKKGQVVASIRAATLIVKGNVQGRAIIRGPVRVAKSGVFRGEINSPSLHVEPGAVVDALVNIGGNA